MRCEIWCYGDMVIWPALQARAFALVSIIFRLVVVVVVVSRRRLGSGARVRLAENNLCYKAAFFLQLHRCMRFFEAHRSVCSTVASSPILAVQLAERALTACNYSRNHPLALSVDVIGSASAGAAQHGTYVSQFLQIPWGFLYGPERLERTSCQHCIKIWTAADLQVDANNYGVMENIAWPEILE